MPFTGVELPQSMLNPVFETSTGKNGNDFEPLYSNEFTEISKSSSSGAISKQNLKMH